MDFDNIIKNSASVVMSTFGKETLATYYPDRRPKVTGIKVIYDPETIAFDPFGGDNTTIKPQITIETAALTEKAKHKDEVEFDGMRFEVLKNEGDSGGLTTLSVRRSR